MAEKIGVAKSTYSLYESGNRQPGVPTIKKIANVLNVSGDELIGIEEQDISPEQFSLTKEEQSRLHKYRSIDSKGKHTVDTVLEMEYNRCNKPHLLPSAAHEIEGATEEDIRHDDDLMNDDSIWD